MCDWGDKRSGIPRMPAKQHPLTLCLAVAISKCIVMTMAKNINGDKRRLTDFPDVKLSRGTIPSLWNHNDDGKTSVLLWLYATRNLHAKAKLI